MSNVAVQTQSLPMAPGMPVGVNSYGCLALCFVPVPVTVPSLHSGFVTVAPVSRCCGLYLAVGGTA